MRIRGSPSGKFGNRNNRGNLTQRDNTKEQFNKVLTGVMTDDSDDADIDNEFDENITSL
jgi:glutamate synthase domain-containing protein 1